MGPTVRWLGHSEEGVRSRSLPIGPSRPSCLGHASPSHCSSVLQKGVIFLICQSNQGPPCGWTHFCRIIAAIITSTLWGLFNVPGYI